MTTTEEQSDDLYISEDVVNRILETRQRAIAPSRFVKHVAERPFIQVGAASKIPCANVLFASNPRGQHLLKFTDIFEQLRMLRDGVAYHAERATATYDTLDLFADDEIETPIKTSAHIFNPGRPPKPDRSAGLARPSQKPKHMNEKLTYTHSKSILGILDNLGKS